MPSTTELFTSNSQILIHSLHLFIVTNGYDTTKGKPVKYAWTEDIETFIKNLRRFKKSLRNRSNTGSSSSLSSDSNHRASQTAGAGFGAGSSTPASNNTFLSITDIIAKYFELQGNLSEKLNESEQKAFGQEVINNLSVEFRYQIITFICFRHPSKSEEKAMETANARMLAMLSTSEERLASVDVKNGSNTSEHCHEIDGEEIAFFPEENFVSTRDSSPALFPVHKVPFYDKPAMGYYPGSAEEVLNIGTGK
jgi:hypothetical protein